MVTKTRRHAPAPPAPNGHGAVNPELKRPERLYEWWLLDPEAYPGWQLKIWGNYPRSITERLLGSNVDDTFAALREVVVEHNGWPNERGEPYPQPTEEAFWLGPDSVDDAIAARVIRLARSAPNTLPNSLRPTRVG